MSLIIIIIIILARMSRGICYTRKTVPWNSSYIFDVSSASTRKPETIINDAHACTLGVCRTDEWSVSRLISLITLRKHDERHRLLQPHVGRHHDAADMSKNKQKDEWNYSLYSAITPPSPLLHSAYSHALERDGRTEATRVRS